MRFAAEESSGEVAPEHARHRYATPEKDSSGQICEATGAVFKPLHVVGGIKIVLVPRNRSLSFSSHRKERTKNDYENENDRQ
jgi:hypothetical protein